MEPFSSVINYVARGRERMLYRANDSSRDTVELAPQAMHIADGRRSNPLLDCNGYQIVSSVMTAGPNGHLEPDTDSTRRLIADLTGADRIVISTPPVHRFAERSDLSGQLDNSRPARFAHVDVSAATAHAFSLRSRPSDLPSYRRTAHYNLWCPTSPPPQDVPLALCDAGSFTMADLLPADAVFDRDGEDIWTMEGLVFAHAPQHRWVWFSDMQVGEAILFKTFDSAPGTACCVPHVAFDNPAAPQDAPPRSSVELRAIAYWV
ncbi:hypothetical protein HT136_20790 [Novosphingobium profundi]|uniref:CmcJ/NvfI family oxidoreductase n=1 Tax=Novosphingobium profundi TaxID=1774954 RepID=UPI001BD9C47C|nr:CmcJ/NvfI family oxidoreductase [Novosphingobium profundi]MBT0670808.1 hypothetical protein [Novosphingobium profundi]